MAKSKKTSLNRAWEQHWDALFPERDGWEGSLQAWFKASANNFILSKELTKPSSADDEITDWYDKLEVKTDVTAAKITNKGEEIGTAPWFSNLRASFKPQWQTEYSDARPPEQKKRSDHYDPIKLFCAVKAKDGPEYSKYLNESIQLFRFVAQRIGDRLRAELSFKIQIGHLEASGLNMPSGEEVGGVEIVNLLNAGNQLDMINNRLSGPTTGTLVNNLKISKGPYLDTSAKLPKSFEPYDHALFLRMRDMISIGSVPSARQAAKQLAPWALRRGNQDSAERRLEQEYPY